MSNWAHNDEVVTNLLRRGFYSTVFQPIVDAAGGSPFGYEALLRGPKGTLFESPGPLFNRDGELSGNVLLQLDMACVGSALRTARLLHPDTRLFINILSSTLLEISNDLTGFHGLLSEVGISPSRIVFEVSESTGMENTMEVARCAKVFRREGFAFALDDIGVHSSYLYHILWLEPEYLKLDKTFIKDVDSFERKRDLVEGIVLMASKMGAALVVEGVESKKEYETLKGLGVGYMQGFLFGRPVGAEDCEKLDPGFIRELYRAANGANGHTDIGRDDPNRGSWTPSLSSAKAEPNRILLE